MRQHKRGIPHAAHLVVTMALVVASLVFSSRQAEADGEYTVQEVVDAGHGFFGETSGALAKVL